MAARHSIQRSIMRGVNRLPERWLRRMALGGRVVVDGKTLCPQTQFLLARAARQAQIHTMTPAEARAVYREGMLVLGPPFRRMATRDLLLAGAVPARLYSPRNVEGEAPLLVFFHGGGFVIGDIATYDNLCRMIAEEVRCRVLAVEYRLAPEHRFPAAIDDVTTAWRFIAGNPALFGADPARIAVAGDSAGGNLAAILCLEARDEGLALPAHQYLIYPATDGRGTSRSYQLFGSGFLLSEALIGYFLDHYIGPMDEVAQYIETHGLRGAPLLAADHSGLPPATLVIAGFDPLQDEGRAYGAKLRAAGVAVRMMDYPSQIHGFISFAGAVPSARAGLDDLMAAMRGDFHHSALSSLIDAAAA